jgi:hypothetical protein
MEAKADTFCSLSISLQPFTLDQLALNLTEFKTPQDFIMGQKYFLFLIILIAAFHT